MNWKDKKILVNGVTGFIGSNLTRELLKNGAIIYSIDNFSYIDVELAKSKLDFLKDVKIIEGDVSDKSNWEKLPRDIEYVFHFAAPSSVTLFNRYPEKCFNETVYGFYNALEYAKKNSVKKVIYPSTGSLYAGNESPLHENVYHKPRNLYAAAKVACEGLANSYSHVVKSIGLRIFAGYGPGEEWKRDFASAAYLFIKELSEGKAPVIFGDGKQTRDFVYIADVVQALITAAEVDYCGVVNVGSGEGISFNEIIDTISNVLGKKVTPTHIPKEQNYIENLKADTSLMKRVLDINPRKFDAGITSFVNYLNKV